jgi:hypothetical protein
VEPTVDHRTPSPVPVQTELPCYVTEPNEYGLYRVYRGRAPQHDPEGEFSLESLCDAPEFVGSGGQQRPWWSGLGVATAAAATDDNSEDRPEIEKPPPYAPFESASAYRLMNWHYSSSEGKSIADVDNLVKNVLLAPDFNQEDMETYQNTFEASQRHFQLNTLHTCLR